MCTYMCVRILCVLEVLRSVYFLRFLIAVAVCTPYTACGQSSSMSSPEPTPSKWILAIYKIFPIAQSNLLLEIIIYILMHIDEYIFLNTCITGCNLLYVHCVMI